MKLIDENLIMIDAAINGKADSINTMAEVLYKTNRILDIEKFLDDVNKRENQVSTSMGMGVAIPHAQSKYVDIPSLVFMKLQDTITWDHDDNVQLIFGIAVPMNTESNYHLKILSNLARKLMSEEFRESLLQLQNKNDALNFLEFLNEEL